MDILLVWKTQLGFLVNYYLRNVDFQYNNFGETWMSTSQITQVNFQCNNFREAGLPMINILQSHWISILLLF